MNGSIICDPFCNCWLLRSRTSDTAPAAMSCVARYLLQPRLWSRRGQILRAEDLRTGRAREEAGNDAGLGPGVHLSNTVNDGFSCEGRSGLKSSSVGGSRLIISTPAAVSDGHATTQLPVLVRGSACRWPWRRRGSQPIASELWSFRSWPDKCPPSAEPKQPSATDTFNSAVPCNLPFCSE